MALAIIEPQMNEGSSIGFDLQTGSNRYYKIAIGPEDSFLKDGVKVLGSPSFTSELRITSNQIGINRFSIQLPQKHFSKENNRIQLITYSSKDGQGTTYSDIVQVPLYLSSSFSVSPNEHIMKPNIKTTTNKDFHYKKEINHVQAMNLWGIIGKAAESILPMVGKAIASGSKPKEERKNAGEIIGELMQKRRRHKRIDEVFC